VAVATVTVVVRFGLVAGPVIGGLRLDWVVGHDIGGQKLGWAVGSEQTGIEVLAAKLQFAGQIAEESVCSGEAAALGLMAAFGARGTSFVGDGEPWLPPASHSC